MSLTLEAQQVEAEQVNEYTRLNLLRQMKRHFGREEQRNHSPFEADQIIRYDTDVQAWDVDAIHQEARRLDRPTLPRSW